MLQKVIMLMIKVYISEVSMLRRLTYLLSSDTNDFAIVNQQQEIDEDEEK